MSIWNVQGVKMFKSISSVMFKFSLLVASVLFLTACGGGGDTDETTTTGNTTTTGGTTFSASGFGFGFGETADPNVEIWKFSADDDVTSPAVSSDGTTYIGSVDKYLYAINPDGSQKWVFRSETADEVSNAPSIDSNGVIYFVDDGGTLYALNPDGSKKWSVADAGSTEIAIANDGSILTGRYALNPSDGSQRWDVGHSVTKAPVFDSTGNGVVYLSSGNSLTANELSDGSVIWTFTPDDGFYSSPAIGSDKTLYFGDQAGIFYAVGSDGIEKWRYTVDASFSGYSTPVIASDGSIYVKFTDGYLYAFTANGSLEWRFYLPFGAEEPVIGLDGTIYITTNTMTALNPDGTVKWDAVTLRNGRGAPVIGTDGMLYAPLRSALYKLNVDTGGVAASAWPMSRQNIRHSAAN